MKHNKQSKQESLQLSGEEIKQRMAALKQQTDFENLSDDELRIVAIEQLFEEQSETD